MTVPPLSVRCPIRCYLSRDLGRGFGGLSGSFVCWFNRWGTHPILPQHLNMLGPLGPPWTHHVHWAR